MTKFVLTGAAGALGTVLRGPLSQMCDHLLSTDIVEGITNLAPNETYARADVADPAQIGPLLEGADMVIHFASIADEAPFEVLLGPNFIGAVNIWEAAHTHGVRRIIYASSVHAVGMHDVNAGIDLDAPHRPDTYYGLAKCFTEDLARMHWEKRGIECVAIRIFSCTPEPGNARALGSWLSHGDLVQLVQRSIEAPTVGYTAIFGISGNTRGAVNNAKASYLGYIPQDNAEYKSAELLAKAGRLNPQDPQHMKLGGPFAVVPLGESGVAMIKRLSEGR
jgi:uronate dehydrogenase